MPVARPCNIYREQLIPLDHGHALWEPNPVEGFYDRVTIGDVGYLSDGFFHRMFNVTLPWDDPSNQRHGVPPQRYDPLDIGPPPNVRKTILTKGYYLSHNVHSQANLNDPSAVVPSDAEGFTYMCKGHGALLSLPHDGHREDAIHRGVFENYIRDNVVSWFERSRNIGLGLARMEDLILVSGCALVTSWGAAVFPGHGVDAAISLADHALPNGGGRFVWGNTSKAVPHHNSQLESDNSSSTTNQCVFMKGFRAKRGLLSLKRIRAAAGPLPDDPDNSPEDEIQVTGVSDDPEYRDPIIGILDYIAEKCSEDVIAIAHDDDLQILENMEALTADAVEQFLHENQIPVLIDRGVAFLHDQHCNATPDLDDQRAKISATAKSKSKGKQVPPSLSSESDTEAPSLSSVETTRTAPPPYETSSQFDTDASASLQYCDPAFALKSPHPLELASSSSHDKELRASSSQRVEEVTTPPTQPELERHESNMAPRCFGPIKSAFRSPNPLRLLKSLRWSGVPPDPDPPARAASALSRPPTVATPTPATPAALATPLASEHSSSTLHRTHSRSRRSSTHSTRRGEGPDPIRRDRRKFAPEQPQLPLQSLPSQDRSSRTFVAPGKCSHSVSRLPNPAQSKSGTRSLTSTMRQVLSNHRKFRILVLGKRDSGKTSLINTVFKVNIPAAPGRDINHEIQPDDNRYLIVHESSGFGPGDEHNLQAIRDFISSRTDPGRANDEKLHAIWICVPTADAISGSIGEGIDEILGMRRVPVVAVFTKFDLAVAIEGGGSASSSASAQVDQLCRSLFRREPRDVPAEIVSVNTQFSDLIDNLVVTTDRLLTDLRARIASAPARSSLQGSKLRVAPVPLLWSAALRVHQDIFIQTSIEIGRSRYWRGLWSSLDFFDQPLKNCVNVIHTDIVEIWNLKDRGKSLSCTAFKETMSHIVKDLAESAGGMPSDFAEWVNGVYRGSQENVRCLMGYIVDLTVILGDISRIALGNVSVSDVQSVTDGHIRSGRRDRIHLDIQSFVTEIFPIRFKVPQRDLFLEKIIELIRQYCVPPSIGD